MGRDTASAGCRFSHRGLIAAAEGCQAGQRGIQLHFIGQFEGIESAAPQIMQLIGQDVADGTQFAAIAVAFAKQPGTGKAAPVREGRKTDRDTVETGQVTFAVRTLFSNPGCSLYVPPVYPVEALHE